MKWWLDHCVWLFSLIEKLQSRIWRGQRQRLLPSDHHPGIWSNQETGPVQRCTFPEWARDKVLPPPSVQMLPTSGTLIQMLLPFVASSGWDAFTMLTTLQICLRKAAVRYFVEDILLFLLASQVSRANSSSSPWRAVRNLKTWCRSSQSQKSTSQTNCNPAKNKHLKCLLSHQFLQGGAGQLLSWFRDHLGHHKPH